MAPTLNTQILADNPRHLTSNHFLVNLATSLNVVSIPLAIFLFILIIVAVIIFIVIVVGIIRQCCRRRVVPKKKKRTMKTVYLDDICSETTPKFGTLTYSLEFSIESQTLIICVPQAINLHNSFRNNPDVIDSYATVALLINENETQKQCGAIKKTEVKRHTANPSWISCFKFQIAEKTLPGITVRFEVFDYDSIGQDISLGWLMIPLSQINITEYTNNILERTDALQSGNPKISGLGDACIGLCYYPSKQKLDVTVFEARKLTINDSDASVKGISFRVKLRIKQQSGEWHQTRIKKELVNPYFNERVSFHITPKDIQEGCLTFSLRKSTGLLRLQRTVGRFTVGSVSTFTTGIKHWEEMITRNSRMHVMWHVIDDKKGSNTV